MGGRGARSGLMLKSKRRISSEINRHNLGNPAVMVYQGKGPNKRQERLLRQLPASGSWVQVAKKGVKLRDLSAMTLVTGCEFALFTKGQKRIIIRGDENHIPLSVEDLERLAEAGYKWSGHTHPGYGDNVKIASAGDQDVLALFPQNASVVYDVKGHHQVFWK